MEGFEEYKIGQDDSEDDFLKFFEDFEEDKIGEDDPEDDSEDDFLKIF